jgi:hypothetical protein
MWYVHTTVAEITSVILVIKALFIYNMYKIVKITITFIIDKNS